MSFSWPTVFSRTLKSFAPGRTTKMASLSSLSLLAFIIGSATLYTPASITPDRTPITTRLRIILAILFKQFLQGVRAPRPLLSLLHPGLAEDLWPRVLVQKRHEGVHEEDGIHDALGKASEKPYDYGQYARDNYEYPLPDRSHRRGDHVSYHEPRAEQRASGKEVEKRARVLGRVREPENGREGRYGAEIPKRELPVYVALVTQVQSAEDNGNGGSLAKGACRVAQHHIHDGDIELALELGHRKRSCGRDGVDRLFHCAGPDPGRRQDRVGGHEERPSEEGRVEYVEAEAAEQLLADPYGEHRPEYRAVNGEARGQGHCQEHARYYGAPVVYLYGLVPYPLESVLGAEAGCHADDYKKQRSPPEEVYARGRCRQKRRHDRVHNLGHALVIQEMGRRRYDKSRCRLGRRLGSRRCLYLVCIQSLLVHLPYFAAAAFWASWRTFSFPSLIHCRSGLLAGHTYEQQPHSMQLTPSQSLKSAVLKFLPKSPSLYGMSPIGQAETQLAHLMQASYTDDFITEAAITVMPDVPFMTGTASVGWAMPIKGTSGITV